jgi:ribokinase
MKLVCIGDAMIDVMVRYQGPINFNSDTPSVISIQNGGAAANTAVWAARSGIDTTFVGRVGDDLAGQTFLEDLKKNQVLHGDISTLGERTGTVVVLVDENGERTMFPSPGANARLSNGDFPNSRFDALYLSGYAYFNPNLTSTIAAFLTSAIANKTPIFFDPASTGIMKNLGRPQVLKLLTNLDFLLLNEEESQYLSEKNSHQSALDFLLDFAKGVVIKLGGAGAIAKLRGGENYSVDAQPVSVVDTTGAGDAFAAGFIADWLLTRKLESSLVAASKLAGECVSNIGARPSVIAR